MISRALAFLGVMCVSAIAAAVDLPRITRETVQTRTVNQTVTAVWWMPSEFWDAAVASNPAATPALHSQVREVLDDYVIFAISHARVSVNGLQATARDTMLANARFEVNGRPLEALAMMDIKPGTQVLLAAMKPLFANMLGSFGQSIEFVLYPNGRDGQRLVDARGTGVLSFVLFDQSFAWRLPLGSVFPPKRDPSTGEEFPGNYQFNPFTGTQLSPG